MAERDIGIAISGGGHRATVFGLGALLAVVDAKMNHQVTSISSVSGGSIANGVAMTGPDFGTADQPTFEAHIVPALRSIATRGVLLGKAPATANYVRLFAAAVVLGALGLIGVLVFAIIQLVVGLLVSLVVAIVALFVAWRLLRQRSVRTERAIDTELLGAQQLTLADVKSRAAAVHHVICTTELQTGESFYFTNRSVYAYRFGWGSGDCQVLLATAVQASACVPGLLNPRVVKLSVLGVHAPTKRDRTKDDRVSSIVLLDGGVYDNMADQWEYGYAGRLRSSPELAEVQPERGTFLVIVNGSGGWNNPKPIGHSAVAQEIAGLARSQSVQYDVSTSHRRQALFDRFNDDDADPQEATGGAFVQITDSPYRLPDMFATDVMRSEEPEIAARADEAIAFLDEQGYDREWWDALVIKTSSVATTLARLGVDTTAKLLEHGYVLTMVNVYVIGGRGSLDPVDRDRFRTLCS